MTKEQQHAVNTAVELYKEGTVDNPKMLLMDSVSGSGKSFTLVKIAEKINPKSGIYLAYNKAIALEAENKFKHLNIKCQTIHSLAYRATVQKYGLKVGANIKPRDIKGGLPYMVAIEVVETIEDFCLSGYTSFEEYAENTYEELSKVVVDNVTTHLKKMADGAASCSHSFYLKLYHILLANGTLKPPKVDLLLLDEIGDITSLTIEIFRILRAPLKVGAGDRLQNVYAFNKTINGFKELKDEATLLHLSKSFRTDKHITDKVQKWIQANLDKDYIFLGQKHQNTTIKTTAYIARTNSSLLLMMIECMKTGKPFNLIRKPAELFGTVLTLLSLKNGKPIQNTGMKFLEKDRTNYNSSASLRARYSSLGSYIRSIHSKDKEIKAAIQIITKFKPAIIWDLFAYVKKNYLKNNSYPLTLCTAHGSKGLEFDKVVIIEDLNNATQDAMFALEDYRTLNGNNPPRTHEAYTELNLYYVACTRARFKLENATLLDKPKLTPVNEY